MITQPVNLFSIIVASESAFRWIMIVLCIEVIGLITLIIARNNKIKIASLFFLIGIFILLLVISYTGGGIHSFGFQQGMMVLILTTAILFDIRSAVVLLLAVIISGFGFALLENYSLLPQPAFTQESIFSWINLILYSLYMIAIVNISSKTINDSIKKTKELQHLYSSIFKLSPVMIVLSTEEEGQIIEANEEFLNNLDYTNEEIIGNSSIELNLWAKPNDRERLVKSLKEQNIIQMHETQFRKKSGQLVDVSISMSSIIHKGQRCIINMILDITDKKHAERELLRLNKDLENIVDERTKELQVANKSLEDEIVEKRILEIEINKAKEKAESANNSKSEFLAVMSHEIRTPINAIVGYEYLLEKYLDNDIQKEHLKKIKDSASHLLSLVNGILDISKIEAGKFELEEERFYLKELIRLLRSIHEGQAANKGLLFDILISPETTPVYFGDRLKLQQILVNLIGNSIKFTDSGFVRVIVESKDSHDNYVLLCFRIIDSGIGIEKEKLSQLFDNFVQGDSSITRKYGGTGLGLSISKKFIEKMGGQIEIDSTLNKGTTIKFHVTLKTANNNTPSHNQSTSNFSLINTNILLVDDNDINRIMMKEILSAEGMNAYAVSNGNAAIDAIRKKEFDCILMDIQMADEDGYEVSQRIRALGITIPILAFTADAFIDVKEKARKAGMNGYIAKPIDPMQMLAAIQNVISPKERISDEPGNGTEARPVLQAPQQALQIGQLQGLNIEEGLYRLNGNIKKYSIILKMFLENQKNCVEDIELALLENDKATAARLAHTLKGVAAGIGASQLSASAESVQSTLEEKDDGNLEQKLEAFASQMKTVVHSIRKYLENADMDENHLDACDITDKIKILRKMIINNDVESFDIFSKVCKSFSREYGSKFTDSLSDAIINFRWKEASSLLDEIVL